MEIMFIKLLNMSITASWLVLAVVVLRLLLKKAPRAFVVVLWSFVGIRLVCPFSFDSVFSLIPSVETIPQDIFYSASPEIQSGVPVLNSVVNPVIMGLFSPEPMTSVNPVQILAFVVSIIWIAGMAAMVLYTIISYFSIYRKVREAVPFRNNIFLCDAISTPFIFGIIRPRIYLPSDTKEQDIEYVIAHEKAHLKRHDHWWKPLGFLLLTVYWFNPVMWLAYVLLCKDIELACDEKVLRNMGAENKKPYAHALINCSIPRKRIAACPLAFGEAGVKGRIQSVLNYKRPAFWILFVAVISCVIVAVCFLTNPKTLDASLKNFIDTEIAAQHQSDRSAENFACVDWDVLAQRKNGNRTTVYMWVLYNEYSYNDGLEQEAGAHIPTAITVEKENGSYHLVEYWIPRDGSYYADDIRSKFPFYTWAAALDSQRFIRKQTAECEKKALEYFESRNSVSDTNEVEKSGNNMEDGQVLYGYKKSVDPGTPTIVLRKDGTCQFTYSVFSSYIADGTYELTDKTLTIKTYDIDNVYVFEVQGTNFVFDASKSSKIPEYRYSGDSEKTVCPVPDGAVFELMVTGTWFDNLM